MFKKNKLWYLLAVCWIILPQLFVKVALDIIETSTLHARIVLLILTGGSLLVLYLIRKRVIENRFKDILFEEWKQWKPYKYQNKLSTRTSSVFLESKKTRITPTEILFEHGEQPILIFFPKTNQEFREIFGRIKRTYTDAYSNKNSWFKAAILKKRAPIILELYASHMQMSSLSQAIKQKIADVIDERDYQQFLEKNIMNQYDSVLLLIDARSLLTNELKERFTPWPRWLLKVVIAMHEKERDKITDFFGERVLVFGMGGEQPIFSVVLAVQDELHNRIDYIEKQLDSSNEDVYRRLKKIAMAFQRADMYFPNEEKYQPSQLDISDKHFSIIELIDDWISQSGSISRKTYSWKKESALIRDYLVACEIFQSHNSIKNEILCRINDNPRTPYVRPFLNSIARENNQSDHKLSFCIESAAHRIIETAWLPSPVTTDKTIDDIKAIMESKPIPPIDWRDIIKIMPSLLEQGAAEKFSNFFVNIPSILRVKCILESHINEKELVKSLSILVNATDIWFYFEKGNKLPEHSLERLINCFELSTLSNLTQTMIVAPHGFFPDYKMLRCLNVTNGRHWDYIKDIPIEFDDIHQVVNRVKVIARLMPNAGHNWLSGLANYASSSSWLKILFELINENGEIT